MANTNAEIAARIVQGWSLNDANDPHAREALEGRIKSALSTAESNLAKQVIAEIQLTARPTGMAVQVVCDLFTRLNVKID